MLGRMSRDKLIKRQEFPIGIPDWYMLPQTPKKQQWSYIHQAAGADLFVHYYPVMQMWSYEPEVGKLRADRGMRIDGKTIYFEVDRAFEGLKIIENKINHYIQYTRETGERFYVIFAILGNTKPVNDRTQNIGPLLDDYNRANQFALASHHVLLNSRIDEEVLVTPRGAYSYATL